MICNQAKLVVAVKTLKDDDPGIGDVIKGLMLSEDDADTHQFAHVDIKSKTFPVCVVGPLGLAIHLRKWRMFHALLASVEYDSVASAHPKPRSLDKLMPVRLRVYNQTHTVSCSLGDSRMLTTAAVMSAHDASLPPDVAMWKTWIMRCEILEESLTLPFYRSGKSPKQVMEVLKDMLAAWPWHGTPRELAMVRSLFSQAMTKVSAQSLGSSLQRVIDLTNLTSKLYGDLLHVQQWWIIMRGAPGGHVHYSVHLMLITSGSRAGRPWVLSGHGGRRTPRLEQLSWRMIVRPLISFVRWARLVGQLGRQSAAAFRDPLMWHVLPLVADCEGLGAWGRAAEFKSLLNLCVDHGVLGRCPDAQGWTVAQTITKPRFMWLTELLVLGRNVSECEHDTLFY